MSKEIIKLLNEQQADKVIHFLSENSLKLEKKSKIYLLKTINEKNKNQTKNKLIEILNAEKKITLTFTKSEETYNIDENGIATVYAKEFYNLFLITDVSNKYYFMLIQENNFFKSRANFELVHLKENEKFRHKIFFLTSKRIK